MCTRYAHSVMFLQCLTVAACGFQGGKDATYGPAWNYPKKSMFVPDIDPKTEDRYPSGIMVPELAKEVIKCVSPPVARKDILLYTYIQHLWEALSLDHKLGQEAMKMHSMQVWGVLPGDL